MHANSSHLLLTTKRSVVWRMAQHLIFALLAAFAVLNSASLAQAQARVEMELSTDAAFPIDGQRAWLELLGRLEIDNIRIRSAKPGDRPEIKTTGSGDSAIYSVRGILSGNNQLIVPQGKFSLGDAAKIRKWIEKIKTGGEEGLTTKPSAFGMYPKDLVELHTQLAEPLAQATDGAQPLTIVQAIGQQLQGTIEINLSPQVEAALESEGVLLDELQAISCGTALAAVLRPSGLVFAPEKVAAGKFRLNIGSSRDIAESWPVGWPVKDRPADVIPAIMNYLNAEMKATPINEALTSISGRLKVPFLVDYNGLARKKIDWETTKVDFAKTRTFYGKVLDRILFSAKLKYEVRLDEADHPFLWITAL